MPEIFYRRGNLYLDQEVYATYLGTFGAAVLLCRDKRILLMPVQQAAGGLLIKIRNAAGDRVINAAEFFQNAGIDLELETRVDYAWDSEMHALALTLNDPA